MCQPRQISIDHPKEIANDKNYHHKLDDFPIEIPIYWMIFPLKYQFMDDFPIEIPINWMIFPLKYQFMDNFPIEIPINWMIFTLKYQYIG
jgi:hypothetical protein